MDERELFNMVNNHSDEARRQEQERQMFQMVNNNSERRDRLYESSHSQTKISTKNMRRKKQNKNKLKIAITSVALAATILLGSIGVTKGVQHLDAKFDINQTIAEYIQMMDQNSGPENSIETNYGMHHELIELEDGKKESKYINYADYTTKNIDNLTRHLVEAANKSEKDFRCALIAAYNIVNFSCEDLVFSQALPKANAQQDENAAYKIPGTVEELLEEYGHENWNEYHNNERKDIVELQKLENKEVKGRHN